MINLIKKKVKCLFGCHKWRGVSKKNKERYLVCRNCGKYRPYKYRKKAKCWLSGKIITAPIVSINNKTLYVGWNGSIIKRHIQKHCLEVSA